jgi:hypothetical protein
MQKWEYRTIDQINAGDPSWKNGGALGWELVAITELGGFSVRGYFKRPLN